MKPVQGLALGGRYHLVRRIAVGGMGEVWVAQDSALGRDVAVKVLREEFAGDEDFLQRLRTEARNNARLSHPGIAQMYDYGEQAGTGYLVQELIHGEPMSDLLEREPVVPVQRLLSILSQASRGLHAAHVAGVVHRDVKPGNILLERGGAVKLTDFGVSLAANQVPMTATGMVMGTAQYLSPEQAIGKAATPLSDVYALGIVAFEALVGKRPFTGPTPVDIAVAHVNQAVPALPGTIDRELAALVRACLEKDPAGRPRTAAVMAQAVDTIAERLQHDHATRRGAHATEVIAVPGRAALDPGRSYPPRRVVQSRAADEHAEPAAARPDAAPQQSARRPAGAAPAGRHRDVPARAHAEGVPAPRSARPTSTRPASARPASARPTSMQRPSSQPSSTRPSSAPRTRADVRRDQEARSSKKTPLGSGGIGPLTWPAVALVAIVVIVLLAAIFRLAGGDGHTDGMNQFRPGDGMISVSEMDASAAHGSPTIEKDA